MQQFLYICPLFVNRLPQGDRKRERWGKTGSEKRKEGERERGLEVQGAEGESGKMEGRKRKLHGMQHSSSIPPRWPSG